jgi:hypothetical protein
LAGESLLVNYWYANPVGHTVEALRLALGYHRARPDLAISLLLNGATATELASYCRFVEATHAVDFGFVDDDRDPAEALAPVQRDWDYVVDDPRAYNERHLAHFDNLRRYYAASSRHFRARVHHGLAGREPPAYRPHEALRLLLPERARAQARRALRSARVRIALMPAGSGPRSNYPSLTSWRAIVGGLLDACPDVTFCLIGKSAKDGRTTTRFDRSELRRLAAACPRSLDCFDRPLAEQLAIVEECHVFLSPHTGFGMAALAVGTPWLTLSGGPWPEYFFNGVPFYSVLPDPARYPAFTQAEPLPLVADDEDGEGVRARSMSVGRIREDLAELVEGARLLVERRLSYEEALGHYFPRLLAVCGGDSSRIWSFDDIHERYV